MAKQLNILLTNMGLAPEKIVIDPLTGALGYGLEYTYSVMERIRTAAFAGDGMLAMPMLATPGYEVAKTKESKAPQSAFPLWGPESERGALLEIATAMSLLNAGADLLVMYHPTAARTVKRKIAEMNRRRLIGKSALLRYNTALESRTVWKPRRAPRRVIFCTAECRMEYYEPATSLAERGGRRFQTVLSFHQFGHGNHKDIAHDWQLYFEP